MSVARGDGRPPAWQVASFSCPHCGAFAHQEWHDVHVDGTDADTSPFPYMDGYAKSGGVVSRWTAAECHSCAKWSLWFNRRMVYPSQSSIAAPHPDMPDEARELFTEAAAVAVVSRRAGAALARATIERLLKTLDPDAPAKAVLAQRIDRIKPRVPTILVQMLEVVRETGNGALHVDDQPGDLVVIALDDEEGPAMVELLLEAANDLVDELVTRPKRIEQLWDQLPQKVKDKHARPSANGTN